MIQSSVSPLPVTSCQLTRLSDISLKTENRLTDQLKPDNRHPTNRKLGFTLIELLVVISIMSLLFATGFAAFREFSRRESLSAAADELRSNLRLTQQLALSGQKPVSCIILNGHKLIFTSNTRYEIRAVCSNNANLSTGRVFSLPGNIIRSSGSTEITFKVIGQGTTLNGNFSATLRESASGRTAQVVVTKEGEIR